MFYTYIHRRNDTNEVFYVGKGRGGRSHSGCGRNRHWGFVAKKCGYRVEVCAHWTSEEDAFLHEKALIAAFRDMGHPLVNMTSGGDGVSGYRYTPEQAEAVRQRLLDYYRRHPEARERIAAKVRAHRLSVGRQLRDHSDSGGSSHQARTRRTSGQPASGDSLSEASRRKWENQETRAKYLEARRMQFSSLQNRNKMAVAHGGRPFRCVETGEVFVNKSEAARRLGTYPANVTRVLDKVNDHANGFHLEWVTQVHELNPRPATEGTV